jgi:hypothetical protein
MARLKKVLSVLVASFVAIANAQNARLTPGLALAAPLLRPGMLPQDPPAPGTGANLKSWDAALHLEIIHGDHAVNIISRKRMITPVVQIRDRNNLPIEGLVVIFSSPSDGPSVTFLNGSRAYTAITDAHGEAKAVGVAPVNTGSFQIHVSASYQSEMASAIIAMTNVRTSSDAPHPGGAVSGSGTGLSHAAIGIIVAVGAAAAVGIAVGLGGHGSASSSASTSPTATVGVASGGSVGAPH